MLFVKANKKRINEKRKRNNSNRVGSDNNSNENISRSNNIKYSLRRTKWFNRNKCRRISEEKTVRLNAIVNPVNAICKNK